MLETIVEQQGPTIVATAVPERDVRRHLRDPVFKVHFKPFARFRG